MVSCIARAYPTYRVRLGYESGRVDRPVLKKAVYVTPGEIREKEIDFVIYIYTPVSLEGQECVKTACEVYNVLIDGGIELKGTAVGGVRYDNSSQGFVVKITGTAADDSLEYGESGGGNVESEKIECELSYVFKNGTSSYKFTAESYRVVCTSEDYPIMTIYEKEPIEIIKGANVYKVVIEGVEFITVSMIVSGRMFNLNFSGDYLTYKMCRFDKYERNSKGSYDVTVEAMSVA